MFQVHMVYYYIIYIFYSFSQTYTFYEIYNNKTKYPEIGHT